MASELDTQKAAGITESAKKNGKVNLTKTIPVKGTGKGQLDAGKTYKVHPIHAETLISKGFAK